MIAQGLDELGEALVSAGNALRNCSWAAGEAFLDFCWMRACLDELAEEALSPEGRQRLAQTMEWMASPRHKAEAVGAFAALQKMMASGSIERAQEFRRKYERRSKRQRGAIDRIRRRRLRAQGQEVKRRKLRSSA
jgi:hypothetical protein